MKKIILLTLITILFFGCIQTLTTEEKEELDLIKTEINELNEISELILFKECEIEFNELKSNSFPNVNDLNNKYEECEEYFEIILEETKNTIFRIEERIGKYSMQFDKILDEQIQEIQEIKIKTSTSITRMKLDMINLTFNSNVKECLKNKTALSCNECCGEKYSGDTLNYYNKCKIECLILE